MLSPQFCLVYLPLSCDKGWHVTRTADKENYKGLVHGAGLQEGPFRELFPLSHTSDQGMLTVQTDLYLLCLALRVMPLFEIQLTRYRLELYGCGHFHLNSLYCSHLPLLSRTPIQCLLLCCQFGC